MPEISARGLIVPESPIRKLAPLANAAKARGTKVYHLNIGQPDVHTPQCGLDALKKVDAKVLAYSPSQGIESYRNKLVGYYAKHNINLVPDDIIVTTGGSEALLFGFMATLNPGDEIIITEPAYANYMSFALMVGAKVRSIHTSIDNGFALPAVEEFEKLINANTRAILICNPNNPTGYVYTRQEMEQIRDIVKKHDLYLFADEVYREYIYTDEPYTSAIIIMKQIVETPSQTNVLCDLFNNIYFEFDKTEITPKAATIIDEIAQIMLTDTSKKYLITGCTDAKGSSQYNMDLSQKRADAVVNALIKKGVPNKMLKAKGVGAKISYASQNAPNEIREGDRKIIVQIITNMDYWNYIP